MSRMIDADALIKKFQSDKEYFDKVGDTTFAIAAIGVIHDIEDAPTIDAVEVVRCKDCKWCLVEDGGCERHGMVLFADEIEHHFCGYGERKETDHE